jgi:hypothetical protein
MRARADAGGWEVWAMPGPSQRVTDRSPPQNYMVRVLVAPSCSGFTINQIESWAMPDAA